MHLIGLFLFRDQSKALFTNRLVNFNMNFWISFATKFATFREKLCEINCNLFKVVHTQITAEKFNFHKLYSFTQPEIAGLKLRLFVIFAVKSVEHDVYSRIKKLEEKILYLEGLSPEYFNYKVGSCCPSPQF
jgi:hypothetical protein